MSVLTNDEKEIIECMRDAWLAQSCPLYGGLCYQQVFDLLDKLEVDKTPAVEHLEEFERCANKIVQEMKDKGDL